MKVQFLEPKASNIGHLDCLGHVQGFLGLEGVDFVVPKQSSRGHGTTMLGTPCSCRKARHQCRSLVVARSGVLAQPASRALCAECNTSFYAIPFFSCLL